MSNPSLRLFQDVSRREIRDRCEKIKSFTRAKKIASIESRNPTWTDLASEQFAPYPKTADSSPRGMTSLRNLRRAKKCRQHPNPNNSPHASQSPA
jgi:hypothetical protein